MSSESESRAVSNRVSENQNPGEIPNRRDLLKYIFKTKKTEISFAIKNKFPFLETIHDNELINDELYERFNSDLRKDVPVSKVVYNVLETLEKKFHESYLEVLFNEVHLKEYPDLKKISDKFEKVIQQIMYIEENRGEGAQEIPLNPLRLDQGSDENLPRSLTFVIQNATTPNGTTLHENRAATLHENTAATLNENRAAEQPLDSREVHASKKHMYREQDDAMQIGQTIKQCAQEPGLPEFCKDSGVNNGDEKMERPSPSPCAEKKAEFSDSGVQTATCFVKLVNIKKEKPFFNSKAECSQGHGIIEISSDEESQGASTSAPKRKIEATDLSLPTFRTLRRKARRLERLSESSEDEPSQKTEQKDLENIGNEYNDFHSDASTLILREEPQETYSSVLRRGSEGMSRDEKEIIHHRQAISRTDTMDSGRNFSMKGHNFLRRLKMKYSTLNTQGRKPSTSVPPRRKRGRKPGNTQPPRRKRGPRLPKDFKMNFELPELPVTCGQAKGTLYKEKMRLGSSSLCILAEDKKTWLTLRDFEIKGGLGKSKNWRLSVRCGGWTLKELIKKDHLPNPPKYKIRRTKQMSFQDASLYDPFPENSNICVVCGNSGTLYCCDSCPRSFHEKCHIHPINRKRDPWYCLFCNIKEIQENLSPQCHQESEVLKSPMNYVNKMKCKFLLLKIFSFPKSSFFIREPYYIRDQVCGVLKEPMWLNKIKRNLIGKVYLNVGQFVADIRLVVENHKIIYKNESIVKLAYQLEEEFENHFKTIFKIQ